EAIALENLALAYLGSGRCGEARHALRDGRKIARTIGDQERLFSLELAAIEERLAQRKSQGINERIAKAHAALKEKDYAAELPRLLRLEGAAKMLGRGKGAARGILDRAIGECRKQKNRTEENRVRRLLETLGASDGSI
ncbi:MAG TPA: hypothetical protein VM492_15725, partial [Sumerlaeia bacterium]|nr:hypothetical protein [Sumerlaeia bacterium]